MGFESRDYMRDSPGPSAWGLGMPPVVKWIIIANVVVFLLQIFVVREERVRVLDKFRERSPEIDKLIREAESDPKAMERLRKKNPDLADMIDHPDEATMVERVPVVQEWLEFKADEVMHGQVWRLVTCAFCHSRGAIFHILFNMLFFYWFGCEMERMYGSREFLLFYFAAAMVSSLASLALDLYTGSRIPALGASGAVMGVVMLFTWHYPTHTILLMFVIPIQMRFLLALYVIWDVHPVLLTLAGDKHNTGIGHAAHLGGLAFGFLYAKFHWRLSALLPGSRPRWRRSPKLRVVRFEEEPVREDGRMDEILQKISRHGQASLSEEERAFLKAESERIRTRRSW